MRRLALCLILAMAASAAASVMVGPSNFLDIILRSPQGLVLVGRTMMAFSIVYPATGSTLLSAFAAIMFNNSIALAAVLASPPLIHSAYTMRLSKRWAGMRFLKWPRDVEWGFYSRMITVIAIMYVVGFGVQIPAVLAVRGPAAFMLLEGIHVFLAAAVVDKASGLEPGGFAQGYGRLVRKYLPIILLLLTISAAVEAYEAVG